MENKITKEELEKIIKQQEELNNLVYEAGIFETKKHAVLHKIGLLNKDIEEYKSILEGIYGQVNINLEDGTYTKIEEDVKSNKKD